MIFSPNWTLHHTWRPRKNTVYRSWTKKPFGPYVRSFEVLAEIEGEKYNATFSVGDNWCEIRAEPYNLITPVKNVSFSKRTEKYVAPMYQEHGKCTYYIVKVKKLKTEDIERFREFKNEG